MGENQFLVKFYVTMEHTYMAAATIYGMKNTDVPYFQTSE